MIRGVNLRDCAPYDNAGLFNCNYVNFIFGANGSGKSTISSFLAGVADPRFASSEVVWDEGEHEEVLVYNRSFRHANLRQTMQGVFTLGSATSEEIRELDELKIKLRDAESELAGKAALLKKLDVEFGAIEKRFCEDAWSRILKQNEDDFQIAFDGLRGSKAKFASELKRRIADEAGAVCTRKELSDRASVLYSPQSERCAQIEVEISRQLASIAEVCDDLLWGTIIAGSDDVDIAALINELDNASWVRQGRLYLRKGSKLCPFCQHETIGEDFARKLKVFFGGEYERRTKHLEKLLEVHRVCASQIVKELEGVLDNIKSLSVGELDAGRYGARLDLLKARYAECEDAIRHKIREPGVRMEMPDARPMVDELLTMICEANARIDAHNRLVDHREEELSSLNDDVWATLIEEHSELIAAYQRECVDKQKAIAGVMKRHDQALKYVKRLNVEIEERSRNVTSVQPTIDEINRSLKAYGFTSFSIQPAENVENHYCIMRDDGLFAMNSLSEGEETFLTFLYFMQQLKGSTDQSKVSKRKVVVLDDPISSLDSTILYIVGAMVKDLSKRVREGKGDVSQLFVLTHNVFFHKEASFVDGRTQELKDVSYWMVRKCDGVSIIQSYGMKNPVTTSYEMLWRELREDSAASLVSVQNAMRRIIENYFGMLGSNKERDGRLVAGFESAEEQMIANSLLYWMNDGSHSIPDDLYIDAYSDAIPRYRRVFHEIFVQSGHGAHYDMMMGNE